MSRIVLLMVALLAAGVAEAQTVVTESDVARQAENTFPTKNWVLYTRNAGTATFRNGPGAPPMGTGSLEMATPGGSDKAYLFNYDHIGVPMASINGMGYATYRDGSSTGVSFHVPSINIEIDYNGLATPGGYAVLVFEPYYNAAAQGNVVSDTWQTWDAYKGGQAIWWASQPINGCAATCFVSWNTILANNPNAVITKGFGINLGSGNANTLAAVDHLMLSTLSGSVTYDFEAPVPTMNTVVVEPGDMATTGIGAYFSNKWFFFDDLANSVDNSAGSFVVGPATPPVGGGSVAISVTGPQRRNLGTFQFGGTELADITVLSFSTYNSSAGNGGSANRSGYLNFDVDFNDGSTGYQNRLVFVPSKNGTVMQDTWQNWDALMGGNALWSWSGYGANGNMWPDGVTTRYRTWNNILAAFPGIKVHSLYKQMAVRVGEPYANGYSENIDRFVFGTASTVTTFDFEPATDCLDPAQDPTYAGGYVLNAAQSRAFVVVKAPRGAQTVRFYNTSNLVVGNPEKDAESGTAVTFDARSGDTFTFTNDPVTLYFPITTAGGGSRVSFYLEVIDECGSVDVDPSFEVMGADAPELGGFALAGAQPNPTAGLSTIHFSLEAASQVRLSVYDVLGREVAHLVDGQMGAGEQSVRFDASSLSSGLYLIRLEADGRALTRSFTVAR